MLLSRVLCIKEVTDISRLFHLKRRSVRTSTTATGGENLSYPMPKRRPFRLNQDYYIVNINTARFALFLGFYSPCPCSCPPSLPLNLIHFGIPLYSNFYFISNLTYCWSFYKSSINRPINAIIHDHFVRHGGLWSRRSFVVVVAFWKSAVIYFLSVVWSRDRDISAPGSDSRLGCHFPVESLLIRVINVFSE